MNHDGDKDNEAELHVGCGRRCTHGDTVGRGVDNKPDSCSQCPRMFGRGGQRAQETLFLVGRRPLDAGSPSEVVETEMLRLRPGLETLGGVFGKSVDEKHEYEAEDHGEADFEGGDLCMLLFFVLFAVVLRLPLLVVLNWL